MKSGDPTVLIMAAGTGGHVFPALSIADCLRRHGARVEWLGTRHGMENDLLADSDITMHQISVRGLRGSGLRRKILAPFMLSAALYQSLRVMARVKPDCVLGMGGFVCGPGGLATKLLGKPLLIHEQNAVAGLTNRLLAGIADRIFEAFPGAFKPGDKVLRTGNPVRADILTARGQDKPPPAESGALRILALGGSQGAAAINQVLPEVLANWNQQPVPWLYHQTGKATLRETRAAYQSLGLEFSGQLRVQAFIEDMAAAYAWADIVLCRSGAGTVSEIAAAGLPAVFVPYPHHRDQQQTLNAGWLVDAGAALLLRQAELTAGALSDILLELHRERMKLSDMGQRARALAICDAGEVIAAQCLEVAGG